MVEPLYLSWPRCLRCKGSGVRCGSVCKCVWRRAFRIAVRRLEHEPEFGALAFARSAEYAADILLAAKVSLSDLQLRIFRMRWEQAATWQQVARRTGVAIGNVHHEAYRIEALVGREIVIRRLHVMEEYFMGINHLQAAVLTVALKKATASYHGRLDNPCRVDWDAHFRALHGRQRTFRCAA